MPMRPAVLAAAAVKYDSPRSDRSVRLLVVGGSQGARMMADIVPGAIERAGAGAVEPVDAHPAGARRRHGAGARGLRPAQDQRRTGAVLYRFAGAAGIEPSDRLALRRRHGGRTRRHRQAFDPGAAARLRIDQDQFANAGVLAQANGAIRIVQADFTSDRLAAEIAALAAEPARLTAMAASARTVGRLDAAERLADLVMKVAGILTSSAFRTRRVADDPAIRCDSPMCNCTSGVRCWRIAPE